MRVFIYEYVCSGAMTGSVGASFQIEGRAMLFAVLEDFARCAGVQVVTLLDPCLEALGSWPNNIIAQHASSGSQERVFRTLAAEADYSLIIAPEFDDILTERCRWVEEAGGRLLGPSSSAVRLTADKLTLTRHWRIHGIPTPPIVDPADFDSPRAPPCPCVLKPRYGAGSQATFLVRDVKDLLRISDQRRVEGWEGESILQAYAPGRAVSVAFVAGSGQLFSLPATEQHLSSDGRFRYLGGRLPLTEELDRRARTLAERAVRCVDGLHGFFGVDLVLGEAADGRADAVIEINPRLTTSYVGLRRLARFNIAEALLALATNDPLPAWSWRTAPIVFDASGRILASSEEREGSVLI